jgi:hypothetical protein
MISLDKRNAAAALVLLATLEINPSRLAQVLHPNLRTLIYYRAPIVA